MQLRDRCLGTPLLLQHIEEREAEQGGRYQTKRENIPELPDFYFHRQYHYSASYLRPQTSELSLSSFHTVFMSSHSHLFCFQYPTFSSFSMATPKPRPLPPHSSASAIMLKKICQNRALLPSVPLDYSLFPNLSKTVCASY